MKNRKDLRLPITYSILCNFPFSLSNVCRSGYERLLFIAAFTLAIFGFCRVSELVFNADFPQKTLMLSDISFVGQCIHVNLRFSKTDQRGNGVTLILTSAKNSLICPVNALRSFIDIRPKCTEYLFCHASGDPLTRYQFSAVLKKAIRFLNLDDERFLTHSFRLGAASQCFLNNVNVKKIKEMGRWKSDSYKRYIRVPQNALSSC